MEKIRIEVDNRKFYTALEEKIAKINYSLPEEGILELVHTEVPEEYRGKGIAEELAKFALDYAKQKKLKVVPSCRFISTYIKRHHEYEDLVFRN